MDETGGADQHHNDNIENHDTNDSKEDCDGGVISSSKLKWDVVKNNVKVSPLYFNLFISIWVAHSVHHDTFDFC